MNVLPVIVRELRAEARHPFTYWLRVLGAGIAVLAAVAFVMMHGLLPNLGGLLFQQLHFTVQLAIWILVPLLAADSISRERREGTLGLLFLTPLRALDIVIAKSLAHGLRSASLLFAVMPVIALPLLIGGVTWQQAVSSLLLNASAISLALAAGLLGSALSKSWVRSLILAYCFATVFALTFCLLLGAVFSQSLPAGQFLSSSQWQLTGIRIASQINPDMNSFFISYRYGVNMRGGLAPGATVLPQVLSATAYTFGYCLLALGFIAVLAAWLTKHNWQDRPPHPLQVWFKDRLCTPVIMLGLLRRWMNRKLDRNPIGWLEQRTWSGRMVIWGWFATMMSVYSLALTEATYFTNNATFIHGVMGWLLLMSMAVNASTSFRRERETRVLELLLVSPLSESQIIFGRLRGLWGQFLPSMVLLLGGWLYISSALQHREDRSLVIFFATSFFAVPVAGLYFSLICRNFLVALVATIGMALALPLVWPSLLKLLLVLFTLDAARLNLAGLDGNIPAAVLFQLASTAYLQQRLRHRLETRQFATEST